MFLRSIGPMALAAFPLVVWPQVSAAETSRICAPRDTVIDRLASGYGETRPSIGLGANDQVVEVLASNYTGT